MYPSVTTVMGYEKEEFFKKWRASVSPHERTYGANRGSAVHTLVENYLIGNEITPTNPIHKMLFDNLVPYLSGVSDIVCQERTLYSDVLTLAGRLDLCCGYNGIPSIVDFKTGAKPKPKEWMNDYFLQVTAYMYMWNEAYPETPVSQGVILYTPEAGPAQEYIIGTEDYIDELSARILSFYKGVHKELFSKIMG